MNILSVFPLPGVSYTHDASACLITDAGVQFAADEERFLRSPHAIGQVPERAAVMAMRESGLAPSTIDLLVTTSIERCRRGRDYRRRLQFVREQLQLADVTRALCVPHHLAHSALAVLTSPFDSCVFLALDGGGDGTMGHWGCFDRGRFRVVETCAFSPAAFFTYVTALCGFPAFQEGKTMGLAAYGARHEKLRTYFAGHFHMAPRTATLETDLAVGWDGRLNFSRVDPDSFDRSRYVEWRLQLSGSEDAAWIDEIPPQDIARTGQEFFSELMEEAVANLTNRTGEFRLACAGGAFHNVAAVGDLRRNNPARSLYIPVAPHDAGLSVGAGLWARHIHGRPRLAGPLTPYLGLGFSGSEVEAVLSELGLPFTRPEPIAHAVAELVASGRVVGWFNGRAEFGARALGARSVLGDPRSREVRARLNQLLKRRDWFMPYAPSVLVEHGDEYFEDFTPSPYMNVAFRLRDHVVDRVPGATHRDGTCRAHVVEKDANPSYRAVIEAFRALTGVPMVLNTSFNRHGSPMVATPRQAMHLLLEGAVDVLAIEGYLVTCPHPSDNTAVADDSEELALMSMRRAAGLALQGRIDAATRLLRTVDGSLEIRDGHIAAATGDVWSLGSPDATLRQWWRRLKVGA